MTVTAKISAIIPTCDRTDYFPEAIASIRAQTLQPTEIIVANNGKHPLPQKSLGEGVQILNLDPYVGVSAARNAGAKAASGDYFAFLDDDDVWDAGFLKHLAQKLEDENADCAVADIYFFNEHTEPYLHISFADKAREKNFIKKMPVKNQGLYGGNFIVAKDAFKYINGFDEDLSLAEDDVFCCKLQFNGYKAVGEKKARYYLRDHSNLRLTNAKKPELNKAYISTRMKQYHKLKQWMSFWQRVKYVKKVWKTGAKYRIKSIFNHS